MYTLKETWINNYGQLPAPDWDGKLICITLDADTILRCNATEGYSLHYSFTIVRQGSVKFMYNGHENTMHTNDFYIYSPGMPITIIEASSDYRSVCILIDEQTAMSIPMVRNLISIAYKPFMLLKSPKMTLQPEIAEKLASRIDEMIGYFNAPHTYKSQVLLQLFTVFILDIQNTLNLSNDGHQTSQRTEELFIVFLRLLPQYFIEHHDIAFYAGQLNISTAYLSRIVKHLTGRTVLDYINQLLAMEAGFLLKTTSLTVAQIADRLYFADTPSFSKFFSRMNKISPKEYRMKK
ncbi:MAG: AraC family transcriptional regulator [Bacteroidales bacterium]|nr:AraC family transcriptional regulator [Bacteroidales bacterium]